MTQIKCSMVGKRAYDDFHHQKSFQCGGLDNIYLEFVIGALPLESGDERPHESPLLSFYIKLWSFSLVLFKNNTYQK